MVRQIIYVHRYNWTVIVYYDTDWRDAPFILEELDEVGADEKTYITARRNVESGLPDTGLTYSNIDERTSVMVLSHASSKAEFTNTWFHEVLHCAVHIARANNLDPDGEAIAYVGGELARSMQPIAARLMCPTCKH